MGEQLPADLYVRRLVAELDTINSYDVLLRPSHQYWSARKRLARYGMMICVENGGNCDCCRDGVDEWALRVDGKHISGLKRLEWQWDPRHWTESERENVTKAF